MMADRGSLPLGSCDERWAETAHFQRHRVEIPHACAKAAGHPAVAGIATHRCVCGETRRVAPAWAPQRERVSE